MKFRAFRHNYHEAALVGFAVRGTEVIIDAVLSPCFNASEQPSRVTFSGVTNTDEVSTFFASLSKLDKIAAPIAQISALQYTGQGPNWVLFELTRRVISDPHEIVIRANQGHES